MYREHKKHCLLTQPMCYLFIFKITKVQVRLGQFPEVLLRAEEGDAGQRLFQRVHLKAARQELVLRLIRPPRQKMTLRFDLKFILLLLPR